MGSSSELGVKSPEVASMQAGATKSEFTETKRGLSPRHVQLMAIGGSIGTGLFVGIGGVLIKAGPLSLVLGYIFWSVLFVWPSYLCVAEMAAYLPVKGSIFELAARFVDPALGFAIGWTYFYASVMLVCVEYSAVATIMGYWDSEINPGVWIAISMVICILLNVIAVKWYGEAEFIMASTKIIMLIGLLFVTFITMVGGNPRGDAYGFRAWKETSVMQSYHSDGAEGRFLGWWKVVIYAGFTVAGPDMIALAMGEIQNPRRTIPRVAQLIFYRLLFFYVIGVFAVGIICSSRDPTLMAAVDGSLPGAAASPWVIGIVNLGISGLPHVVNAGILLSGLSCGNAYLYSASRTLYGLARDGQAPRFLLKCNSAGVPLYCVGIVSLLTTITFLVCSNSAITVFYWFVDLTTTGLIATYLGMVIVFVGWSRARKAQGLADSDLPYVAPYTPYITYVSLLIGTLAIVFVGFDKFKPWDTQGFITSYFCVPYSLLLFFGWKYYKKTSLVTPEDADLVSGKAEIDAECAKWEDGGVMENFKREMASKSFLQRTWITMWS
ncbi:putative proline-specific permease put4 [Ceratocystis platani]|uniref:Putative proline-specific permease put4 n=1 Tax=Ceratocystis fimbriata f. sp. platani TaxID=88771 RepID=A0A0F8CS00_CERFI|nr:putative proline-specific permease put4 [Ceratocystis platani]